MEPTQKISPKFHWASISSREVDGDVYLVGIKLEEDLDFKPGQYIWLGLPVLESKVGEADRRAFSIADYSDDGKEIKILFRKGISTFKKTLQELELGAKVKVIGPFGSSLVFEKDCGSDLTFIAGGVGIAPFLALIKHHTQVKSNTKIYLNYFTSDNTLRIPKILETLRKQNPNFEFIIGRNPSINSINKYLDRTICVVGSQRFVDLTSDILSSKGVARKSIVFEQNYPTSFLKKIGYDFYYDYTEDFRKNREEILAKFIPWILIFGLILVPLNGGLFFVEGIFTQVHLITEIIILVITIYWFATKNVKNVSYVLAGTASLVVLYSLFSGIAGGYTIFWLAIIPVLINVMIGRRVLLWGGVYLLFVLAYTFLFLGGIISSTHDSMSVLSQGLVATTVYVLVLINSRVDEKRKENFRAVLKKLNIFKNAVESSSNHIIVTDENGSILFANKAAQEITGFSLSEMKDSSPRLWGGEMDTEFYRKLWKAKASGVDFDGEITNRKKNGSLYTALAHISPIIVENKIIGYIGTEEDITQIKNLNKLKDEFVSMASHELRTPMTAIKGFSSMIMDGDYGRVPKEMLEPLSNIQTSTERLIHLINDMLNLSRIEAGRMKINPTKNDLGKIVTEVVGSLVPIAEEKKLTLLTEGKESVEVQADGDKVREIIINLVGNSLKFTEKGGITVKYLKEGNYGIISVIDTGVGIPLSERGRVFGKFEQIVTTAKGKPPGTGLGLYISKMLAQKMGGNLIMEKSEEGKGSTFSLLVPLVGTKEAASAMENIAKEAREHPDQKDLATAGQ